MPVNNQAQPIGLETMDAVFSVNATEIQSNLELRHKVLCTAKCKLIAGGHMRWALV